MSTKPGPEMKRTRQKGNQEKVGRLTQVVCACLWGGEREEGSRHRFGTPVSKCADVYVSPLSFPGAFKNGSQKDFALKRIGSSISMRSAATLTAAARVTLMHTPTRNTFNISPGNKSHAKGRVKLSSS